MLVFVLFWMSGFLFLFVIWEDQQAYKNWAGRVICINSPRSEWASGVSFNTNTQHPVEALAHTNKCHIWVGSAKLGRLLF